MNISAGYHEPAVEVENLGPLSPEWYLWNLLSQTMVKLREQSGLKALFDRVVPVMSSLHTDLR